MLPFLKRCKQKDIQMQYSKIKSLMLYDKELENIPEFGGFEDNFRKFNIYGHHENDNRQSANLRLQPKPLSRDELRKTRIKELFSTTVERQNWPGLSSNAKCKVLVRVYVLRAYNLHPTDTGGSSDPYIEISFGHTRRISDRKNYVPNTLNPIFGRYFEKLISFPKCSTVTVRIMDHDMIGKDDLIGETTIDIESRFYSKHRAQCGLSSHYNRTGYNRWRDFETPSKILHRLCECNALKPPVYTANGVLIGPKKFFVTDKNASKDRQSLALHALKNWHELPVYGHHLVPEHVETRTLINPDMPNMHQGKVEMWIDMFPKSGSIPEPVNVKPPVAETLELRVIVWSVADVQLVDDNFFTGEKSSDIYIKGWMPGVEEQSTDIHYRSINGEGFFNWRFKFPFVYFKSENRIVQKSKGFFSLELEERSYLPSLHLQIWDNDHLSTDSYIGYLTLDLWNMPRGTKTPVRCTVIDDQVPRINLFKMKKTRGWWPFVNLEKNSHTLVGKIDAELQILTKQEADRSPAGFGRDAPQPLPEPKRPTYNYFNLFFDPCTFLLKRVFNNNKTKFCSTLMCIGIVLFMILFVYAFPGWVAKKILDA
ncbi:otoferlin-like [Adelges cooleyi]|uniref:otoferlin-like n=1 Tax=Adelges cooleyi TaxID=133065 RepID=UPI00218035C3|nr:otoferlin-like [Adelges cooleyi]